mgnify:CR=1 FL=1
MLDLEGFDHKTGRFDPAGKIRLVTAAGVPGRRGHFRKYFSIGLESMRELPMCPP